jgi:hypothetical protein
MTNRDILLELGLWSSVIGFAVILLFTHAL